MTLVAAVGFPGEVLMISDSRVSYRNNIKPPKDELKKIFQLNQSSLVSFTSEDVRLSQKIIENVTIHISNKLQTETSALLKEITTHVSKTYRTLTQNKTKPTMIFLYAALINRPYKIKVSDLILVKKYHGNNSFFPAILKNSDTNNQKGKVKIPGPTPLIIKQILPRDIVTSTVGWDYTCVGSGYGFEKDIETIYTGLFCVPGVFNKGVILTETCRSYVSEAKNQTIGGTVQVFSITKDGVSPVGYKEGDVRQQYIDQQGNWVDEDLRTGQRVIVRQNPTI